MSISKSKPGSRRRALPEVTSRPEHTVSPETPERNEHITSGLSPRVKLFYLLMIYLGMALSARMIPVAYCANDVDTDAAEATVEVENDYEYVSPMPTGPFYFAEHFDDPDLSKKRWLTSKAEKEQEEHVFKYDGEWDFQLPQKVIFSGDRSLVMKSKAKHAAIAAKLDKVFEFSQKPLFVQYEVTFQNGMDCGGAYIKLLSSSPKLELNKFHDKTPYTLMFGPDKCGNDHKLHFIFRHKNPINGTFEEKHAKKPTSRLEENYTDKKPHLYLLQLFPDNTFKILVDGSLVNSGSLLEDMTPPVNPPAEIEDAKDKKPADWDERETIPDSSAKKPEDWDEDAPKKIPDPNAVRPAGWLVDEEPTLPDETAVKPDDWDDSMDGDWEPPMIANPACEGATGCGPWLIPEIDNPDYKGKWKAPTIPNPNYKGKWSPRKIPNPNYFDDKEPFKMTAIGAVGIEIWAMTNGILFDNFIITDDKDVLYDWTAATYDLKIKALDKDSEGVFSRIMSYSNAHPWIWAVYVVVIGMPIVLFITFCCGSSQEKKEGSDRKKTDEVEEDDDVPDDQPEPETPKQYKTVNSKEDLEEKDGSDDEGDDDDDDGSEASSSSDDNDDDDAPVVAAVERDIGAGGDGNFKASPARKRRARRD